MSMADPIPDELLRRQLDRNRAWHGSNGELGGPAELDGADLGGRDLSNAVLVDAHLRGTTLAGAVLRAAKLDRADLTDALLGRADLGHASLAGASIERTSVDETTTLAGADGLETATIRSIIVTGELRVGWRAAAWLARRTIVEPPPVALQAYLLGYMRNPVEQQRVVTSLGLTAARARTLHRLLAKVFDVPGHAADEYEAWLGPPLDEKRMEAGGTFAGSRRRRWALPAWPEALFGVSAHVDGYAWDVGFEEGRSADLRPGASTYDRIERAGVTITEHEWWPPHRDVALTDRDGSVMRASFVFDLLDELRR